MKKIFLDKKMDLARHIFNSQHSTTNLIDLFWKRYKINENDQTFRWLCLNEVSNYLTFLRIFELANHCCVIKNERRFDIRVDIKESQILVSEIRSWLLTKRFEDHVGNACGTIENICMFGIL